jgi:hypothetical protein
MILLREKHSCSLTSMMRVMHMPRNYMALDIETASTAKDDWRSCRPLGISCAATLLGDKQDLQLWHGGTDRTCPADRMSREEAAALVEYLADQVGRGYTLATWNGLGFDFDIVAEESGMWAECRRLAAEHVDMMFHIFCQLGHGVGLDAAARGMGIKGKPEGMSGAVAPVLWAQGKREEVLAYVAQDVRTTMELATACEASGTLRWIARSGNVRTMALPEGWLPVDRAEKLPKPDTSWMSDPWPRAKLAGWMRETGSEPCSGIPHLQAQDRARY